MIPPWISTLACLLADADIGQQVLWEAGRESTGASRSRFNEKLLQCESQVDCIEDLLVFQELLATSSIVRNGRLL